MGLGLETRDRRLSGTTSGKPGNMKSYYETQEKRQKSMQQELQELTAKQESQRALEVLTNRTKSEVLAQVEYIYAKSGLTPAETKAVALVTYNMGLDPSPGVGHLYAWKQGGRFCVQIGYQGWLFKARQEFEFVYTVRPMTPSEREEHGLGANELGAICELYEMTQAKRWRAIGIEPKPIIGTGIVGKSHDAPNGRSVMWVAEKRATVDAIRHLGLGFGPMMIPQVENMSYDIGEDAYVMDTADDTAIEGDFTAAPADANGHDEPPAQSEPAAGESPAQKPETEDPKPAQTEAAGRAPETSMDTLAENLRKKSQHYSKKDAASNAKLSEDDAQSCAIDYDAFFGEALDLTPSKATKARKAFLSFVFQVDSFKDIAKCQRHALDDWRVDEHAARIEAQAYWGVFNAEKAEAAS